MSFNYFLVILLFISLPCSSFAQHKIVDRTKIDSIAFKTARERINSLSTEAFEKHQFIKGKDTIPYRLLRPNEKSANKKYPLVITFHNSSRIGRDNEKQLEPLTKTWIRPDIRDDFKCFVFAPQFSVRSSLYKTANEKTTSTPSDQVRHISTIIDELLRANPAIDARKIYLVGYSMGASTAINLMSMYPEKFAALIAIAAVPDFSNIEALKNKRIYLIHGEQDTDNPYQGSLDFSKALQANKKLVFKTFPYLDHGSITIPFLSGRELPNWLFNE